MANHYSVGDLVRVYGTFKTLSGDLVDPTTITCKVKDPVGAISTYTYADNQVKKESPGKYYYEVNITKVGTYYYRFNGTGLAQAALETFFEIVPTQFS